MERHHRFEQARCACSGLGMANLRLHATEGTPLLVFPVTFTEGQCQATELCGIASLGSGSVGLDQLHSLR